jgi:3-dehydroquinate dehydratase II
MKILVIHGPNLNLLGTREPEIYGRRTLSEIDASIQRHARDHGAEIDTVQTNHEGEIIDHIQGAAATGVRAIVINPGAYTHTSLAIADAIRAVALPVVEVHLSNLHARGPERARSVTASACIGIISGFGFESYLLGIDAAIRAAGTRRAGSPRRPAATGSAKRPPRAPRRTRKSGR